MIPSSKPFWQTFLFFVIPLMAANILQSLSGTINNIFLGQMLGVKALAAAAVFFPIMFLFISFLIGMSAGASVLIGQAYGAQNHERIKAITGTVLTVSVAGGLVLGVLSAVFAPNLLAMLGTPEDIFPDAVAFARVSFLSMPVMFLFFIASSLLRGVGDTVTPLVSLVVSTVIGALATPALIQGWLGLPQLGVVSAAVASLVAFSVSVVALALYLRWRRHAMAPDLTLIPHLRPDPAILKLVLRLGVPTGIQMVTGAVAGIVIIGLVNRFGSDATAAYGAVNQVLSYVQFPAISIAIAASIFGAQAIGADRADQLGQVTRVALMMNLLLTGSLVVIVYLGSEALIGLFIADPEIVELSEQLLRIVTWSTVLFGAGSVLAGVMRSSGTVLVPMLISIFSIVGIELPVAVWLSGQIGITGIWWGYVASFAALPVLQGAYFWFVWRSKRVVALI
jgi:putative MATE family efflux protein